MRTEIIKHLEIIIQAATNHSTALRGGRLGKLIAMELLFSACWLPSLGDAHRSGFLTVLLIYKAQHPTPTLLQKTPRHQQAPKSTQHGGSWERKAGRKLGGFVGFKHFVTFLQGKMFPIYNCTTKGQEDAEGIRTFVLGRKVEGLRAF